MGSLKMYKRFLMILLIVGLSGCSTVNMPDMPKMPDMANWFSSFGGKTQQAETTVTKASAIQSAPMALKKRMACNIAEGSILVGEQWYDYNPVPLGLTQGAETLFRFEPRGAGVTIPMVALYADSGQRVAVCPAQRQKGEKTVRCEHIYALEDDFERGIQRTLDIPPYLGNGKITCRTAR
jgi:uncharacterized protein YceK